MRSKSACAALWEPSLSSAPRRVPAPRRPPRSVRPPAHILRRRHRSLSGAPKPAARSSRRPLARRTSATSSPARRPSTWASSTSRSTTRRWRYRAATARFAHSSGSGAHLAPGRDRGGNARHPRRSAAGARPRCGSAGDSRWRLCRLSGGDPRGTAKTNGLAVGRQIAATVTAWRTNDGRDKNPTVADLDPPTPGPGVWQPDPTRPVLGLRLPGIRPLALTTASQFRPDGPPALTSHEYADDLNQVEQLGAIDGSTRTPEQTEQALFFGPTTTSGCGTTACSASPPTVVSTSSRPRACLQWRTSPAATP